MVRSFRTDGVNAALPECLFEYHSCEVSALRLRDTNASVPMTVVSDVLSRAFEALDTSDDALLTEDTNRLLATDWAWRKLPKRVPLSFFYTSSSIVT